MDHYDVLIIGGGHGGAHAAIALRQLGFGGSIAIVSGEPEYPYERPPLSKEYLSGDKGFERILIRPPGFWSERNVAILLGRRAVGVDAGARSVTLDDGDMIGFGTLVWAAGGSPRKLACDGHDLAGVHYIRNRKDADQLARDLADARNIVVVGGGYIGLEAAAVLRKRGLQVTLIEAQSRVLARVAGAELSEFVETVHRQNGVEILTGTAMQCLEGSGRVTGVRLEGGTILPADLVIVGIGIIPEIEPLVAAGALCENGVVVDAVCRTTLPDIFAIGDCAAHPNVFAPSVMIRLESVQNAVDQARIVAKAILGDAEPYAAVPWFWSNQYDLKIQIVGLSSGFDQTVIRGNPAGRSFSICYLRTGRIIAMDCVNSPKDYVQGRKLVERALPVSPTRLADADISLKSLADEDGEASKHTVAY